MMVNPRKLGRVISERLMVRNDEPFVKAVIGVPLSKHYNENLCECIFDICYDRCGEVGRITVNAKNSPILYSFLILDEDMDTMAKKIRDFLKASWGVSYDEV